MPGGAVRRRRRRPRRWPRWTPWPRPCAAAGVRVHVFDDEDHTRPDSVFPNNWLSTHAGGNVAVYPMYASNRRHERRADVLEMLKSEYRVQTIVDYSGLEPDGIFLEGTGAMVLDHVSRVAYTARSHRADTHVLERFCTDFGYEPMAFDAVDSAGRAGLPHQRHRLHRHRRRDDRAGDDPRRGRGASRSASGSRSTAARSSSSPRSRSASSPATPSSSAGVRRTGKRRYIMAMSARARRSLRPDQVAAIEESCEIVAVDIPTIELAGGSVRCMIAGVHLDRRPPRRRARAHRRRRGDRREPAHRRRPRRGRRRLIHADEPHGRPRAVVGRGAWLSR